MSRSAAPATKSHTPPSPNTAPATKSHTPASPNTAPATQNESHQCSASHMKRHFQCAQQAKPPSNLTKYCACHEIRGSWFQRKIPELLPPIERRFEHIPNISDDIRGYPTIKLSSRARRFGDLPRAILATILYWKIQHFALRLSPKMSRSAAPATESHTPPSPNINCDSTELLLYWTVTVLNCDSTELLPYWTVTLLNCYSTELWLYWTVTLLNCDSTELWLYWTVTLLNCDSTELLLYWTVTLLNCYSPELWLYWTVTLLNCDSTELLLYWTVTLLNCDSTELLLSWTVTLLNCDSTELLLSWTVTLLNCYSTEIQGIFKTS